MYLRRLSVSLTVNASGDLTAYTEPVTGFVYALRYVPDGTAPLDNTWDATITAEVSGLAILTITNGPTSATSYFPRAATVSVANAAALYAAGGTAVNDLIPIAGERIKVVIAQGGNAKTGTLYFWVG